MFLRALFSFSLILSVAADVDTGTVSIQSATDYLVTPGCIQDCLIGGIKYLLNCQQPFYNQCFCNLGEPNKVTSYLSTCIPVSCSSNPPAIATAQSLYSDYCSGAGYPFQGGNAALPTGEQADSGSNGGAVTATRSSVVTATATSISDQPNSAVPQSSTTLRSSISPTTTVWIDITSTPWTTEMPKSTEAARSGGGGGGYSTSDKISLGVGIGIGLPAALCSIGAFWWKFFRGNRDGLH